VGDIPDAVYPRAECINNKADILIWATLKKDGRSHSYLWSRGVLVDIGSLGGRRGTYAHAINDKRRVVGVSETPDGSRHAFLWQDGKMTDLGTLGGKFSEAWDINNAGQVVGWAENAKGKRRAFLWDAQHGMRDLGAPGLESHATAINDKGQVVGISFRPATSFLWQHGKPTTLEPTPPTGFNAFQALNLNEKGEVIGVFHRGGPGHSESRIFLHTGDKMIPVEPPQRSQNCNAFGLTSSGLVVGNAFDTPTGQHAFEWQDGRSVFLNDLLAPGTGWDIYFTLAVNGKGEIAACGRLEGKQHVVLLSPQ